MASPAVKKKARLAIMVALYKGDIERPAVCSVCRMETKIEAHHEDYDKPLDVVWLCRKCHTATHVKKRGIVKPVRMRKNNTGGGKVKLKAWAKSYGVKRLSEELGVNLSTVYGWLKGTMTPSDSHRLSILHLAGRKLKLGDIVEGF